MISLNQLQSHLKILFEQSKVTTEAIYKCNKKFPSIEAIEEEPPKSIVNLDASLSVAKT